MEKDLIAERMSAVLVSELGLDESKINEDARFEEDLDVDSLGVVELLMALEDEFDVKIPDEDAESIMTVGQAVDLVHGKMKAAEKDAAMARFASGQSQLLIATTVIEVGVDVPEATIMVIEHAERFGLAQLHQLRGRVGRGSGKSTCLLLYKGPLGETAKARLAILRESEDGFRIAEEDLKIRGPGELLGTKQHGLPELKVADLIRDYDVLVMARRDAQQILRDDPTLSHDRHEALRGAMLSYYADVLGFLDVG